jgi:hypothetical protein
VDQKSLGKLPSGTRKFFFVEIGLTRSISSTELDWIGKQRKEKQAIGTAYYMEVLGEIRKAAARSIDRR